MWNPSDVTYQRHQPKANEHMYFEHSIAVDSWSCYKLHAAAFSLFLFSFSIDLFSLLTFADEPYFFTIYLFIFDLLSDLLLSPSLGALFSLSPFSLLFLSFFFLSIFLVCYLPPSARVAMVMWVFLYTGSFFQCFFFLTLTGFSFVFCFWLAAFLCSGCSHCFASEGLRWCSCHVCLLALSFSERAGGWVWLTWDGQVSFSDVA